MTGLTFNGDDRNLVMTGPEAPMEPAVSDAHAELLLIVAGGGLGLYSLHCGDSIVLCSALLRAPSG